MTNKKINIFVVVVEQDKDISNSEFIQKIKSGIKNSLKNKQDTIRLSSGIPEINPEPFFENYPKSRIVDKKKCIEKLKKYENIEEIIEKTNLWCAYWKSSNTDEKYIPMSSTFINQERWNTEIPQNKANYEYVDLREEKDK